MSVKVCKPKYSRVVLQYHFDTSSYEEIVHRSAPSDDGKCKYIYCNVTIISISP